MTLTCREFSRLVASDAIAELPYRRRLEARVHAWLCRHCRRYQKEIQSLGPAARQAWESSPADAAGADALAKRILERISQPQEETEPDARGGAEPGS